MVVTPELSEELVGQDECADRDAEIPAYSRGSVVAVSAHSGKGKGELRTEFAEELRIGKCFAISGMDTVIGGKDRSHGKETVHVAAQLECAGDAPDGVKAGRHERVRAEMGVETCVT